MNFDTLGRFLAKFEQAENGCWLWTQPVDQDGYGRIGDYRAHRVSYLLFRGELQPGLEIDHVCHTLDLACPGGVTCIHRRCVNPQHLELVTHRENGLRGRSLPAANAAKTHCSAGHPFDEANTYVTPGRRQCRRCNAQAVARYTSRKKVAA